MKGAETVTLAPDQLEAAARDGTLDILRFGGAPAATRNRISAERWTRSRSNSGVER